MQARKFEKGKLDLNSMTGIGSSGENKKLATMPKNKYKLQPVLDVRERAKQEAAQGVATRRAQLAEAEAELLRREQAVMDCQTRQTLAQAEMLREIESGTEARQVVAHRTHLADLREAERDLKNHVEQQKAVVTRAESNLEAALAALIESSRELQVIEKHRASWSEQTRRVEQRREQKVSDEIGSIIYGRRGRDEVERSVGKDNDKGQR
jgi:flagellar export protein FliJ